MTDQAAVCIFVERACLATRPCFSIAAIIFQSADVITLFFEQLSNTQENRGVGIKLERFLILGDGLLCLPVSSERLRQEVASPGIPGVEGGNYPPFRDCVFVVF